MIFPWIDFYSDSYKIVIFQYRNFFYICCFTIYWKEEHFPFPCGWKCLSINISMNSWILFLPQWIILYCPYLFWRSNLMSQIWPAGPPPAGCSIPAACPAPSVKEHFLTSSDKVVRGHLVPPLPRPGTHRFSQEAGSSEWAQCVETRSGHQVCLVLQGCHCLWVLPVDTAKIRIQTHTLPTAWVYAHISNCNPVPQGSSLPSPVLCLFLLPQYDHPISLFAQIYNPHNIISELLYSYRYEKYTYEEAETFCSSFFL